MTDGLVPDGKPTGRASGGPILTEIVHPAWERQPDESARNFQLFSAYRDLEPADRSLTRVHQVLGEAVSYGHLKKLSFQWQWVKRAGAWDDERDREVRSQRLDSVKKMNERHAKQAMLLQTIALMPVQALMKRFKEDEKEKDLPGLTTEELLNLALRSERVWGDAMLKERLVMGETTEEVGRRSVERDTVAERLGKTPTSQRHLNAALYELFVQRHEEETGREQPPLPAALLPTGPDAEEAEDLDHEDDRDEE